MIKKLQFVFGFLLFLSNIALCLVQAEAQTYLPPDVGYVDFSAPGKYHMFCDGLTDDTKALQLGIAEARSRRTNGRKIGYLPSGICLVSPQALAGIDITHSAPGMIVWKETNAIGGIWQNNFSLQGRGNGGSVGTVIRLKDNSPGFGDPNNPRAILFTASAVECGTSACSEQPQWVIDGSGNKAFHEHVWDLRIDCGRGNLGCVGLDFHASNTGSVRNVSVYTPHAAHAGIRMERYGPGPLLLKGVGIGGQFKYGIAVKHFEASVTMERVQVNGARVAGLRNESNAVSVRNLFSTTSAPAILNVGPNGLVTLIRGVFQGGSAAGTRLALQGEGKGLFRDVTATRYLSAAALGDGGQIVEHATHAVASPFNDSNNTTLRLPIQETPNYYWSTDPNEFVRIDANRIDNADDTAAIQAAMNACLTDPRKKIVYAAGGGLGVGLRRSPNRPTITIPPCVRTIHGMGESLWTTGGHDPNIPQPNPTFTILPGNGGTLTIMRLWVALRGELSIDHKGSRALVVRDSSWDSYRIRAGKIAYFEDAAAGRLDVEFGAKVWARQLNLEPRFHPYGLRNDGGDVWVLGHKTEAAKTQTITLNNGRTEILGGDIYAASVVPANAVMHEVINACATFSYLESVYDNPPTVSRRYPIHVRETRNGIVRTIGRPFPRGNGSIQVLATARGTCP